MFGSNILEWTVGLVLVYLLLSAICSWINERVASLIQLRGAMLVWGVYGLVRDYTPALLNHPLIAGLANQTGRAGGLPSYIPAQNFGLALLHTIMAGDTVRTAFAALAEEVKKVPDPSARSDLLAKINAVQQAGGVATLQMPAVGVRQRLAWWYQPLTVRSPPVLVSPQTVLAAMNAFRTDIVRLREQAVLPWLSPEASILDGVLAAVDRVTAAVATPRPAGTGTDSDLAAVRDAVARLDGPLPRDALLPLIDAAQGDFNRALVNIEDWFNGAMDRLSGWYKRHTWWFILVTACLVTVVLNADTLAISTSLWRGEAQRTITEETARRLIAASTPVAAAVDTASSQQTGAGVRLPTADERSIFDQVRSLHVPIGYTTTAPDGHQPTTWFTNDWWNENLGRAWWPDRVLKLAGWLTTALALSLGAPFWFDLLNKLINARYSGNPPAGPTNAATA